MKFIIYHHKSLSFANYFKEYSELSKIEEKNLAIIEIENLPATNTSKSFAELPYKLRKLLFYAKPDMVICLDDGISPIKPIFCAEITEHVPAGDHWLQRFNNLVGSAQENIPGVYIQPFDLSKRENFSGKIDPAFFYTYERVIEIHKTPIYIAEWTSQNKKTLDCDIYYNNLPDSKSQSMKNVFSFFKDVIEYSIHGRDLKELMKTRIIFNLRDEAKQIGYQKIPQISDYKRLNYNCPENKPLNKTQFNKWLQNKTIKHPKIYPDRIEKRDQYLIFIPQIRANNKSLREKILERIEKHGGDPYLGQPLAFDYMFCRLGQTPHERDTNLVIDLSMLSFKDLASYHKSIWENCHLQHTDFRNIQDKIPSYTMYLTEGCPQVFKNILRVFAFSADIIVFDDGVVYFE